MSQVTWGVGWGRVKDKILVFPIFPFCQGEIFETEHLKQTAFIFTNPEKYS